MTQNNQIFVKPKKGVVVINLQTNVPLNTEGEFVENSAYYRRRIADLDLEITKPPKAEK